MRIQSSRPQAAAPEVLLREGSRGPAVKQLQERLSAAGFSPGAADGEFGPKTRSAVEAFQRSRGLEVDGVAGQDTWAALSGTTPKPAPAKPGEPPGQSFTARGTGYFPDSSAMEGGFTDRKGRPLHTLQDFLAGRAPYVSVAMDPKAFPYGTKLRIPELEKKYGRPIEFRVVDTGGAFFGKGTGRIDVCTKSQRDSLDPTINGPLHLVVQR
jgi:peptidoglycan hydrolase-like protein with peptidoglycan-binding domain